MSASGSTPEPIERDLFPTGKPSRDEEVTAVVEQYKLMLQTTESLEARRQALHTFFMSINSLLLAAIGVIGKESLDTPAVGVGVVLLGLTGAVLSASWQQQIVSHGGVLASKWDVLNHIEEALPARPFCAEWQALQRRQYRSFTEIECRVPRTFIALYALSIATGLLLVLALI
jgi:hypothetical protein